MADKFPRMPRIPKRVKEWMSTHSIADLEAAMWDLEDKRAEVVAEILSIMYELTDDLVGIEAPKVEVFA